MQNPVGSGGPGLVDSLSREGVYEIAMPPLRSFSNAQHTMRLFWVTCCGGFTVQVPVGRSLSVQRFSAWFGQSGLVCNISQHNNSIVSISEIENTHKLFS